ncbi:MAG: hypothetical protein QOH97_3740, partial [Actinoplanes sp.]|nr:hypothetical protein [Actinoplanes sp.]
MPVSVRYPVRVARAKEPAIYTSRTARPLLAATAVAAIAVAVTGLVPAGAAAAAIPASTSWIWDTTQTQMTSVAWNTGADAVWSRGITGKGVGVALIDTGVTRVEGLTGANI